VATPATVSPRSNDGAIPLLNLESFRADVLIVVFANEVKDVDLVSLLVAWRAVPGEHVHDNQLAVSLRRRDINAVLDCWVDSRLVGVRGD